MRDVTDRLRAEQEIRTLNTSLEVTRWRRRTARLESTMLALSRRKQKLSPRWRRATRQF